MLCFISYSDDCVMPHLSATRIMRRRFLPSSRAERGLARAEGGKKMFQAALNLPASVEVSILGALVGAMGTTGAASKS